MFSLPFPSAKLVFWASRYMDDGDYAIVNTVIPRIRQNGYFTKDDFLTICEWKSPRPRKHYTSNPSDFIQSVTQIALTTPNERLRIEVLTLLDGVSWPVASTLLHFVFSQENLYPILDFRALWSLGINEAAPKYNFDFWWSYTTYCRQLSSQNNISMRELDRALWQFSKEMQSET